MHILCPTCQSAIEVVKLTPREEIACPSCGSTFRIDTDTTTATDSSAGRKIGKFYLMEAVGRGTFGTVYRAHDPELDRTVAIKVPRAGNLAGAEELDRFLREARSVAQLRHPSIVSVHEVGEQDGLPYLVSDFVRGVTLADLLSARRPTFREAAEMIAAVADALQYAHDHGVVHRDVKPSNIMVGADGKPCVMDFGLARRDAGEVTMTMEGQVLGTPAYMPPEQARGEGHTVDARGDVYSLGVVLYQLLTGELPFRGTQRMLLHQVIHDEPNGPRSLNDRIPRDLETICLKGMAKEPERRYAGAGELRDDLRRYLAGEPIQARPTGRLTRLWLWARRNPRVAALTALVWVLLVVATVGATLAAVGFHRAAEQEKMLAGTVQQTNVRLEAALYSQSIALAERELSLRQDVVRAEELLENCPPRLRGWEWYLLERLLDGPAPVLRGHTGGVWSVAFSPTSHRLASGSIDGTTRIWDADTGQEVRTLPGSVLYPVLCLAFSPDGKRIVAGGLTPNILDLYHPAGVVKIWDAEGGRLLRTYTAHEAIVIGVGFSPDGRQVASSDFGGVIHLWDAETGKTDKVLKGHTDWVNRVSYSPDGKLLASPSMDGTIKLWDTATGETVRTLTGHSAMVRDAEFSRDGRRLASAGLDGAIKLWDVETGTETATFLGHNSSAMSVAFHPDGKRLASGGFDKTVKIWDLEAGKEAITLRGHTDSIVGLAFSADGHLLASGSFDKTVRIWDATPREAKSGPAGLALAGHKDRVNAVAVSPDGKYLATAGWDNTIRLWNADSGAELRTLTGHQGAIWGLSFGRNGQLLASASWDRTVKVWDVASGRTVQTLVGHGTGVHSVSFHPDGRRVASGCLDGVVKIWDVDTGKELRTLRGHLNLAYAVAFSHDGKTLASGAGDRTIKLWDPDTGKALRTLSGHEAVVDGLAFSRDNKTLASASWDHTIKIWDLATGQNTQTLTGHTDRVLAVDFAPEAPLLVSSSEDKTVRVWDVRSGREVMPPRVHRGIVWGVAFHPDGHRLASACWYPRAGVTIWQGAP